MKTRPAPTLTCHETSKPEYCPTRTRSPLTARSETVEGSAALMSSTMHAVLRKRTRNICAQGRGEGGARVCERGPREQPRAHPSP